MNFNNYTVSFCEKTIYGHPPEYINAFTSIFLILNGLLGLFLSNHHNIFGKLYYASMAFNGIGSFGYHWTNYIGWRFMDEYSMIILALSALISVTICLINTIFQQLRFNKLKSILFNIAIIIIVSYLIMVLVLDSLDSVLVFRISLGIFLGVTVIEITVIIYLTKVDDNKILTYYYFGTGLILLSCVMWLLVELLCFNVKWIKYVPGHAIWHIGMSFGGYYLGQYIIYIMSNDLHYWSRFNTNTWYYKLYPQIIYERKTSFLLE